MGHCAAAKLPAGRSEVMKLALIFEMLQQAKNLTGHQDFVIVGSLSILGVANQTIPAEMSMSNDVDCYTKTDPSRIFDLVKTLGENTAFHEKSGIFLDAVSPDLPTLPDGWGNRLMKVEREGLKAWFLDPNDAAISKYARGEPRDRRWIEAGISQGLISLPMVQFRVRETTFLDTAEESRVKTAVEEDSKRLNPHKERKKTTRKKARP